MYNDIDIAPRGKYVVPCTSRQQNSTLGKSLVREEIITLAVVSFHK